MSTTTGNKVFAPAIFFIAVREALEASLVIGILSGMLESLIKGTTSTSDLLGPTNEQGQTLDPTTGRVLSEQEVQEIKDQDELEKRLLVRRLRKLILLGALTGLLIAFAIGAAFLAVFYTQVNDLYGKAEELWEGIFNLIAVLLITPMSLAILRADRSRAKWRRKLKSAFANKKVGKGGELVDLETKPSRNGTSEVDDGSIETEIKPKQQPDEVVTPGQEGIQVVNQLVGGQSQTSEGKSTTSGILPTTTTEGSIVKEKKSWWRPTKRFNLHKGTLAIFTIPMITTLREGLEGVVFIGGVSLGLPASSIPLPAVVGLVVGLGVGWFIFKGGNFVGVKVFLLVSTSFLLLIASGMASRSVFYLQTYAYVRLVGDGAAESGSGPGSYDATSYIWHLNCCNPENNKGGTGWGILNSIVGWENTATYGSVLTYVFYWLAVMAYLWYSFWKEGRVKLVWRGKTMWEPKRTKEVRQRREENRIRREQNLKENPSNLATLPDSSSTTDRDSNGQAARDEELGLGL
ncbi:iron permease FTR1 [Violaceomyces palustris]|uniref:Iron permease FTR1 n=1 Tax=Violaceomyces palustris TaxID=1673888 RepID=A0ACD0NQP3_9BASI|nr:iron permease FTR1 [Violaceomyces palustris]